MLRSTGDTLINLRTNELFARIRSTLMSLLSRYVAGECEEVWQELVQTDVGTEDNSYLEDVLAVVRETARRGKENLRSIHARLVDAGYDFEHPERAFVEADDESRKSIAEVECRLGRLPILARIWYENVASVDFSQTRRQCLEMPDHPLANLGWYPHVRYLPLDHCLAWADRMKQEYSEWYEDAHEWMEKDGWDVTAPSERPPFLPIGGHASNCEAKGFELPSSAVDGIFFDDGDGPTYFNEDIRFGLAYGGFPRLAAACRGWLEAPRHPDPDGFLAYLTRELAPL